MLKTVKLGEIKPNHYRHFETYSIQPAKIAALIESIKASGFWGETVIARPAKGGGYELAFGHHRIYAFAQANKAKPFDEKSDIEVTISVRQLDNDIMLKMMARENNEAYAASALQDIEMVKAAIEAHTSGEITLPAPKKASKERRLEVERFLQIVGPQTVASFTRDGLHECLALSMNRIDSALGHLASMREGVTDIEDYKDMAPDTARELKLAVSSAKKHGKEVQREVAKAVSKAIREKPKGRKGGGRVATRATAKKAARDVILKATKTDAQQTLIKFRKQIGAAGDAINGARLKLNRLTDALSDAGITQVGGFEIVDLNQAIADMKVEINVYEKNFTFNKQLRIEA